MVKLIVPPKVVAPRITSLGSRSVTMTGAEQTLVEQPPDYTSKISGYIDLGNFIAGDSAIIRMYIRVRPGGSWRLYHEDGYNGPVSPPLVHVAERPENHGLRVTVQQTAGVFKIVDYEFYQEV